MSSIQTKPTPNYSFYSITLLLGLVILVIGTGLYEAELMPKDEYLVSILCALLFLAGFIHSKNISYIEPKILFGFLIFNGFFILRLLVPTEQDIEIKTFFIHIITLGIFTAVYSASMHLLSNPNKRTGVDTEKILKIFAFVALIILLASQLIQIFNGHHSLTSRPGGFLNPNTTAALSLIFAFSVCKLSQFRITAFTCLSLTLTTCIVLLSQSRAAFITALLLFALWVHKKQIKVILIASAIIIIIFTILLLSSTDLRELFSNLLDRFRAINSSTMRVTLLLQGWNSFIEEPIWGNGYQYLSTITTELTHNTVIEVLTNFGLIGLFFIGVSFYFLYIPFSTIFCIACVFPVFLFSHNFFDLYAFQASLGLALAADRITPEGAPILRKNHFFEHN